MNYFLRGLHYPLFFTVLWAGLWACHAQDASKATSVPFSTIPTANRSTSSDLKGEIRGIGQDAHHNLWFASNGHGVYQYNGQTLTHFTTQQGLCSDYVWMLDEDRSGQLWFKTFDPQGGGLTPCRYDGKTFQAIPSDPLLHNNLQGHELLCDYFFDGQSMFTIQVPHTSPINPARNDRDYDLYATYRDRKGNLWFGTQSAGLCKWSGKTYTWFTDEALCVPIRTIFEDSRGTIWVGNNGGGLFRYDGQKFINFSKENNLHNPDFKQNLEIKTESMSRVWKITEDKKGNLWVATIDQGIWKYDGKKLTHYTTKDGLGINHIWTLFFDHQDQLWVGTAGAGVYTFDGKRFNPFTVH